MAPTGARFRILLERPVSRPPAKRQFREPKKSGQKDVDSAQRARMLRAALGGLPGGFLGFLGGFWLFYHSAAELAWLYMVAGPVVGWTIVFGLSLTITEGGGRLAGTLYNPSGKSTPRKPEHSQAQSLVARGKYREAVDAYELLVIEHPTDTDPYIQLARIHRDHLDEMEGAVRWFRRALQESEPSYGQEILAFREIVELFSHRMGEPTKAGPYLAQLAEKYPDTPDGQWAERELWDLKRLIAEERDG
jgi:hypothetical protein